MKSPRPDLLDDGVYRVPSREKPRSPRCPPQLISRPEQEPIRRLEIRFDVNGQITPDDSAAVAKRVQDENRVQLYFCKMGTTGHDQGRFVNPRGMYFRMTDLNRSETRLGRERYAWKRVAAEVFSQYLKFLTSKNEQFLRQAERGYHDA
jgi:hypothetical protein